MREGGERGRWGGGVVTSVSLKMCGTPYVSHLTSAVVLVATAIDTLAAAVASAKENFMFLPRK